MAREGKENSKGNKATIAKPDPNSKRSKRRANRGFKGLEVSSRKHRRALRRSQHVREISGKLYEPGDKIEPNIGYSKKIRVFTHNAGGSLRYH